MRTYFFVLGTNHTLCKIDIVNGLLDRGLDFRIREASEEILIIETEEELGVGELILELGSAAKVGEVLGVFSQEEWKEKVVEEIARRGKGRFGISVYLAGGKFKVLNKVFGEKGRIVEEVKKKTGWWVVKEKKKELPTVLVDKKGLIKKGDEWILGVGKKEIYFGKTLAIQDYKGYSLRDWGRPKRDPREGMIPPKLAKMMILLAGKGKEEVFWDPFCGRGTILQELILLGYRKIIGSDASKEAVEDCLVNLDWLFEKFSLRREDFEAKVFQIEAERASSILGARRVDAIVTEPYLGKPERRFLRKEEILREKEELEGLYLRVFEEFKRVLKEKGVVAMILPIFRWKKEFLELSLLEEIERLGFRRKEFLRGKVLGEEKLCLQITKRGSVVFFRPGQKVVREIFLFEKVEDKEGEFSWKGQEESKSG